jgi:hypothetical protein
VSKSYKFKGLQLQTSPISDTGRAGAAAPTATEAARPAAPAAQSVFAEAYHGSKSSHPLSGTWIFGVDH